MSPRNLTRKILFFGLAAWLTMSQAGRVSAGNNVWTNIGPEGVEVIDLAIDPQRPNTVYAGSYGVYRTTDGGGTWAAVNTGLTNTEVFTLAIDPQRPGTVYAGTRGGVFKTTDGGDHWTAVNSGLTNLTVGALAIDPLHTNAVYAGTSGSGVFAIRFVDLAHKIRLPLTLR